MKKLSIIFLILSLLISVNAYAAVDWYQTTNLMGGTIGTNTIGSAEGEDATFTGNLDTKSNTVLPSCTNAKPCPIVVYDATCGSAWCSNKEFITVKTITGSSNPYTFTIKARNADSDGPTCTSCAFVEGAKFDMVRANMFDKQMQTVIDGKWDTPTYSTIVGLWTTCTGLLGSGGTCTTDNSSNWNTAYGWGNPTNIITSSISDSDLTHCPDGNSVFDALAGKCGYVAQSNCASPLIAYGVVCRDTDDNKWYKLDAAGTGIEEVGGSTAETDPQVGDVTSTYVGVGNGTQLSGSSLLTLNNTTGSLSHTGVLGNNSVLNGTFDTDASWSNGTGWAIDTGDSNNAIATATTGNLNETATTVVVGKYYQLVFDVVVTSGTFQVTAGGWTSATYSASATITQYFYATTTGAVTFDGVAAFTGTIDNVTLKEVQSAVNFNNSYLGSTTQPLVVNKTLSNATGNQTAMEINYQTNKVAGDDTGLKVYQTDTLSPGTSNLLDLGVGVTSKFKVSNTGYLTSASGMNVQAITSLSVNTGGSADDALVVNLTSSEITSRRVAYVAATLVQASGAAVNRIVEILPTYNQSGTQSNTDIRINRVETAIGSGIQRLISAGTGGGSYVEKFGVGNGGLVVNVVQAETCAENGSPSTLTITPTSSYIEITNSDAEGCNITMGETGMLPGMSVTLCVVSNAGGVVTFADTAGVTELAGAFAATIDQCITLRYGNTTVWRETSRSAN